MRALRIHIDIDQCDGQGQCNLQAADLYLIDDDGFAARADFEVPGGSEEAAERGAASCPMASIDVLTD